jgi:hypothetical protein
MERKETPPLQHGVPVILGHGLLTLGEPKSWGSAAATTLKERQS